MTASYTEISFNTQSSEPDDSILEDFNDYIPEAELLSEVHKQKVEAADRPNNLGLHCDCTLRTSSNRAAEFLNHLNGTVIQDGPLVSFVAEDLETKIKLSSPEKSDGKFFKVVYILLMSCFNCFPHSIFKNITCLGRGGGDDEYYVYRYHYIWLPLVWLQMVCLAT